MEIVLLLKITDCNEAIVYHPRRQREYTVSVSSDQAAIYRVMLSYASYKEDVFVVLDTDKEQLTFVEESVKLR